MQPHEPISGQTPDPCIMTIFGAGGDLTKRKLIPALCNLAESHYMPRQFALVGFSSGTMTSEEFRAQLTAEMKDYVSRPIDPHVWSWLMNRVYFIGGDFANPADFQRLKDQIEAADKEHGTQGNKFFYLAVAPRFFGPIVKQLGQAGLAQETEGKFTRVIVEKPFGRDLDSARQLNRDLKEVLKEDQIYRIDHYLGKETVQNIMVFRFGNSIFEPIWNRHFIDHVQITAAETVGVEHRGGYYETSGALRDMVPNHLFQLLTLTAMEPPVSFDANAVRGKQVEVLQAIQPCTPEEVLTRMVRGQYGESGSGDTHMPGYRTEPDVSPTSQTDTYVALKLAIDNWRWAGVPFYLRTGKRLAKRVTEIAIQFRRTPFVLFRNTGVQNLQANKLIIGIQPDEKISIRFGAKIPGPVMDIGLVNMDFDYSRDFGASHSTGYERLLYDCMIGDATLFQRADMVESGWNIVQSVMDVWRALPVRNFPNYAAGGWGPAEADELLHRDGREWRQIE
jgi:glucose-6-phosphate 1-dehydrogenase